MIDAAARFRDSPAYAHSIAAPLLNPSSPAPAPLAPTATDPTAATASALSQDEEDNETTPQQPHPPLSASSLASSPASSSTSTPTRPAKAAAGPGGAVYESVAQWLWHCRVLLGRTARTYVRNPGNVLVRVAVMALLALLQGTGKG